MTVCPLPFLPPVLPEILIFLYHYLLRSFNVFIIPSCLKRIRQIAGLSQNQLAQSSGVPVRTIQQYEQRQKNINKAQAEYIFMMASALGCQPEALIEHCWNGM